MTAAAPSFLALVFALGTTPIIDDPFEEASKLEKKRGEPSSTPAAFPDDNAQHIWVASCAMCHARTGNAKTYMGRRDKVKDLTDPLWQKGVSDAELSEVIRYGVGGTKMKGFEKKVSKAQLTELVKWVRTLAAK
jgi:mono/diheme cytochrome c family protein